MPWLRGGDNAATHPIVMRVVSVVRAGSGRAAERDVAVNEVFGFVVRCALQAAGHTTDYVIDEGTALMIGGARTDRLLEIATRAGYLKRQRRGGVTSWLLVDEPDFLHMRTKAELEHEKQRKIDNSNPALTVPVRLRDGDECRYCGILVNWRVRKGGRGGTYDHRERPATISTLVVACNACNAGRLDDPEADLRYPLREAPTEPRYGPDTAAFLENHGHRVTVTEDGRPGSRPDTASDPAAGRTPHQPPRASTGHHPAQAPGGRERGQPPPPPDLRISADPQHDVSGFAGTGRDRDGSGTARTSNAPGVRPKRSRRGRAASRETS